LVYQDGEDLLKISFSQMKTSRLPTFFLSHGGGPWPYTTGEIRREFASLESSLKEFPRQVGVKPKAILVVSGHWEDKDFAVMANPRPPMVYDYGGFPETRHMRYAAPGSPELAQRVHSLIQQAGLPTHLDPVRGFDHGTYSLLAVTHPEAEIPVIQVSIRTDYDPESHLHLGRALAPLRDEGILIIGSGSSYHNFHPKNARRESARFDAWLKETLVDATPNQRSERLLNWNRAPFARAAQPEEDHLVPLFVAVGAAEEEPGKVIYREENFFGMVTLSNYQFGLAGQDAELSLLVEPGDRSQGTAIGWV
jgi:aromatic ring-opening dioxygenase catalytic subunit (LigB family)